MGFSKNIMKCKEERKLLGGKKEEEEIIVSPLLTLILDFSI